MEESEPGSTCIATMSPESEAAARFGARVVSRCDLIPAHFLVQESAPGSTFIATMSPESEVAKWRAEKNSLGGVNEHVYWGHPDDLDEVQNVIVKASHKVGMRHTVGAACARAQPRCLCGCPFAVALGAAPGMSASQADAGADPALQSNADRCALGV